MKEIWTTLNNYSYYLFSDQGRIMTINGREICQSVNAHTHYSIVTIRDDAGKWTTKYVHRLIARAFLGEPEPGMTVNHKDECKTNNALDNLEYLSMQDNLMYGTRNQRISRANKGRKRSEETRERMRIAKSKMTQETKDKIGNSHRGMKYKHSEAFLKKQEERKIIKSVCIDL